MRTFDDILRWFNGIVATLLLCAGSGVEWRWPLLALHLFALVALPRLASLVGGPGFTWRALITRALVGAILLPLVFSETGLLLPFVNPEPLEWSAFAMDRWLLGGGDISASLSGLRSGYLPDILILCYSSFYFLPLILFFQLFRQGRIREAREVIVVVTFGFLASYLCYYVTPVLPPFMVNCIHDPGEGGDLYQGLFHFLGGIEVNKRDCFPSGHTWLTLTVMHLAWRQERRLFFTLLPIAVGLILATVVLRLHFLVDILAAAILYYPSLRFALWMDREGGGW